MKLVLSPPPSLAEPRGWSVLPAIPRALQRPDEVHCVGGGSLFLYLLVMAGRAPRCNRIVLHGDMVVPTPESCGRWLTQLGATSLASTDPYEWRRQATVLGLGRNRGARAPADDAWLLKLSEAAAAGRFSTLEADMLRYVNRWAAAGRLTLCSPREDDAELCCDAAGPLVATDTATGVCAADDARCSERAPMALPDEGGGAWAWTDAARGELAPHELVGANDGVAMGARRLL